jgi:hypothetical protein
MHDVTHRSHRMQKHNFGITRLGKLFNETTLGPPEHEKYFIDISRPECTGMHYMTRRSHRMQKPKFEVTCPGALFMETAPGPPDHEK